MSNKAKILAVLLASALALTACGQSKEPAAGNADKQDAQQNTEQQANKDSQQAESGDEQSIQQLTDAFKAAVDELNKAKEGKEVDYQKVMELYQKELQPLVQKRDAEFQDQMDQHISAILEAGKNGEMDGQVVKQVFDKLMQKVFFLTVRHEFTEVAEHWGDKEKVTEEITEAKEFYGIIQTTVQKRDQAYSTNMESVIEGGFGEIEQAVASGDQLAFNTGKQVVDKTLMKTFYLATGALPHGYASKIADEAGKDANKAKVEQAEGWAFFQSVYGYMKNDAAEEAAYIEKQFNLATDVKEIDPKAINHAFIRGFAKVALQEYKTSVENWGQDYSVITALEGALFIDIIESDLKTLLGEDKFAALKEQAQAYLDAAKAKDKDKADPVLSSIQQTLNQVIEQAK